MQAKQQVMAILTPKMKKAKNKETKRKTILKRALLLYIKNLNKA